METQDLITIQDRTTATVRDRIPRIIELLAEGKTTSEIGETLGIGRVAVWKNLQRVDFKPIVSMLITDILEEIDSIESPDKRVWSRIQLVKALHSKKTTGELTITRHDISEERKTARLVLDRLDPETQRKIIAEYQELKEKGM